MIRLSETLKRLILLGKADKSFFKKKGDQHYIKFDSMRVEAKRVCFFKGDVMVFTMDVPGPLNYTAGETLTIDHLDAKMKFEII